MLGRQIVIAAVVGLLSSAQAGTIVYVDDDAPAGGDGSSWDAAYKYLRDALADAVAGDEIRVAQGTYRPHQDESNPDGPGVSNCCLNHGSPGCDDPACEGTVCTNLPQCCDTAWDELCVIVAKLLCDPETCVVPDLRALSFDLVNGLTLAGGFAGVGAPDPDARDVELYETILSGDRLGDDVPGFVNHGENSYQIIKGAETDLSTVLDGLTVTAGNADGFFEAKGGGLFITGGGATVNQCRFLGNRSASDGGGGNLGLGASLFTSCLFEDNESTAGSGGGLTAGNNVTLTDCRFVNNIADDDGGGALIGGGAAVLTGCLFEGNEAGYRSGGLLVASDTACLVECVFVHNRAVGSPSNVAGAMSLNAAWATLDDCHFEGNESGGEVGAVVLNIHGLVSNCTFIDNMAAEHGGAVWAVSEDMPIVGCTFAGNVAAGGHGGAIYSPSATGTYHLVARESTFAGNTSFGSGGAIYADGKNVTIEECFFERNTAASGGAVAALNLDESETFIVGDCTFIGNQAMGFGSGGAVSSIGNGLVANCDFIGNSAFNGGGVLLSGAQVAVSGCTFADNAAAQEGGGFILYSAEQGVEVVDCLFTGNIATRGGALHASALFDDDPHLDVRSCVFLGNGALNNPDIDQVGLGGAVFVRSINAVVANSVFSGNFTDSYGGAFFSNADEGDDIDVVNCTLAMNTAMIGTGGAFDDQDTTGATFANCIFWNNDDPTGQTQSAQIASGPDTLDTTVLYGCIQGWDGSFGGAGNIDADPMFVDPGNGNFRIVPGSPCIDAGDNSALPNSIDTDLDGNPRFLDVPETPDTGNGASPVVDMGAYESLGGGCLALTSQEVDCHPDGSTFTLNIQGVSTCVGDPVTATFTGSGGAVGEDLCFTMMVNQEQGGFCCSTQVCAPVPDCSEATADLDGDGVVGVLDLILLLTQFGTCQASCWADMDHDGAVSVTDLLILLVNWD